MEVEMKPPTVTVDIDAGPKKTPEKTGCCGKLGERWSALEPWQKAAIVLTFVAVAVVVTVIVVLYAIAPAIAQSNVDNSRFVMEKIVMSNPSGQTVEVSCTMTVYDAGPMAGTVKSSIAEVLFLGMPFATIVMPEIQIKANEPTTANANSPLVVFNNHVFQLAARQLLAGNSVVWTFKGDITVEADFLPNMHLSLSKDVLIPGIDISQNTAFDVVIVGGETPNVLNTTVTQTFVTTSINTLSNVGRVTFDLFGYYDAQNKNLTKIGIVTVPDFGIVQGFNTLENVAVDLIQGDNETNAAISKLLSNYNTGRPTNIIIAGPTECASPFFLNTARLSATLNGAPMHTLAVAANINLKSALGGGVYLTAYNPYNKEVVQSDMVMNIALKTGLPAYTYTSLHNATNAVCPPTTYFSQLYQASVPSAAIPAKTLSTFFLNLGPAPGQSPECFASSAQAIMCMQQAQGQTMFEVSTAGSMRITFDNFSAVINYDQDLAPTFFEALVFYAANAEYQCANYNFTQNPQYVPVLRKCPSTNGALDSFTTIVPAGTISKEEKDWVLARKSAINAPANGQNTSAWMAYLNNLGLAGFNPSQNVPVPTIAIAASGGGYRAMFASMGVLSSLDARNGDSVGNQTGGLLQSATYLVGLSGGGWTVGSIYDADFKPANAVANSFGSFNFWKPDEQGGLTAVAEGWADVIFRTATKKFAGFDVSLTDLWGQMLSKQMMTSMDTRMSGLLETSAMASFQAPFPILTAAQVFPGDKNQTAPKVMSFSPFNGEIAGIGGGDKSAGVTGLFSTQYLGTVVDNGVPTNEDQCVVNFDNLGFVVGMESAAFEVSLGQATEGVCKNLLASELGFASWVGGTICGDLFAFLDHKETGKQLCQNLVASGILPIPPVFVPVISTMICGDLPDNITTVDEMCDAVQADLVPKFDQLVTLYCTAIATNETECQSLNATVQAVIAEIPKGCAVLNVVQRVLSKYGHVRVPPAQFANPFYNAPAVAAAEPRLASETTIAGIDGAFAEGMNIPFWPLLQTERAVNIIFAIDAGADTTQNLPNGASVVNAAAYAKAFKRPFPKVPTLAQFNDPATKLLNKTTFFGCGKSNVPTIVYIPNRFVTYQADAMPGTLQLAYEQGQINQLMLNAFATSTGFADQPNLARAIGCAVLDAGSQPLPRGCTDINWQSFCWK